MRVSYGGSGALARQITYGAPADLFLSANADWMDVVQNAGHITKDDRIDLLTNKLVIVGSSDAEPISLKGWRPDGRIAVGFVSAVPAGQYAKSALENLGLWGKIMPHLVEVENVRAALALVERRELPFAVVYASDAVGVPSVKVLHEFAAQSHPKIIYPLGLLTERGRPVFEALQSQPARAVFQRTGFEVF